ncbi:MAG: glutamine--tRNA ligase/YqeY domain fusion protein [Clostridia bacterium]|nr:glutamine--tRNA ligase/YqeY domain fusion protein [Clostridia bacterium]
MNFIEKMIKKELENKTYNKIVTRFPPEPNGYLHIGSAFAINISYQVAKKFNGKFNLRFDDTNPLKEDLSFVKAIEEDFKWMGFDYGEKAYYGSDYSEQIYGYAITLIEKGLAYVCHLNQDEMRNYRGTLTEKGKNSPYRERSVEENLMWFEKMKSGELPAGACVLRAKIDMKDPNLVMRDPVIYRIIHESHYRTLDAWCIYPMYDFAHPIQDYIEGVTHSLCSNEFVNHRPLYEWVLNHLDLPNQLPRQIEFGRLNMTGVVTSKRYLKQLVASGVLDGWNDPRLPTLMGLKERGITPSAIFSFLNEIGVPKNESTIDYKMLEYFVREELKPTAPCLMTVIDPLKVIITNLEQEESLEAENHFEDETFGKRPLFLTKEIYIEREDFSENPPLKYKRLTLGGEVRLKHGFFIHCHDVIKDENGEILELHCTYDPETKSGSGFAGRKVKGTIHWVSSYSRSIETRAYEDLFLEAPDDDHLIESVNPDSKKVYNSRVENFMDELFDKGHKRFQFIRQGYYYMPSKDLIQRIVTLKGSHKK